MKDNQVRIADQAVPSFICFNSKSKGPSDSTALIEDGGKRKRSTVAFNHAPTIFRESLIRRSTMPKVTQEDIDSLPPIHEIARLLMPPVRKVYET
jgi:hypothetical protein